MPHDGRCRRLCKGRGRCGEHGRLPEGWGLGREFEELLQREKDPGVGCPKHMVQHPQPTARMWPNLSR